MTRHTDTETGSDSATEQRQVRSDGGTPGTRRGDTPRGGSRPNGDARQEGDAQREGDVRTDGGAVGARPSGYGTTVIAQTIVRLVVPIIVVTALALLFQGHNRPGGGFIGAVLTATAAVLVYVTFGREFLQTTLFGDASAGGEGVHAATEWYRSLFGVGLAVAVAGGVAPMFLGGAFLTQGVWFPHGLPLYGELEVATALVFDLGVYATVVGGLLTVVSEVGGE